MSTKICTCVNPKLKCHPNVQSRNVTFLLAQNTEFATALARLDRVLAEVELAPGMRQWHRATLLLRLPFLLAVLVLDRSCTRKFDGSPRPVIQGLTAASAGGRNSFVAEFVGKILPVSESSNI